MGRAEGERREEGRARAQPTLPGLDDCVHCGLCLPSCPTYAIDRRESENPRGRVAALRAIDEGRAPASPGLLAGLEDCLVCRACESACPSGVSMETLMLHHRAAVRPARADLPARVERFVLEEIVATPARLEPALAALRLLRPLIPPPWRSELPSASRLRPRPLPAAIAARGPRRGRVALMRGCFADRLCRGETIAAGELLAAAGFDVEFGAAGCCGALHRHAGLLDRSRALARERARDLLASDPDRVVVDSAGCAAALLEPLDADPAARELALRLADTPTLLEAIDLPFIAPAPGTRVALAVPCHQAHGTRTTRATRALLERALPGALVELPGDDLCCGAAGFYSLRRRERSRAIGSLARVRWERAGRPEIATGNPGCLLRWESLLAGQDVRVDHPVVWAARALAPRRSADRNGGRP